MYGWQAEDAARRGTARVEETSGLIRCMSACRPRQVLVTETWFSFPGKPEMIPHQSMRSCHEKAAVEWLLSRQQAGLMLSSYLMPVYKSSMPNGDQTTSNLTSIAGNGYHVWRLSLLALANISRDNPADCIAAPPNFASRELRQWGRGTGRHGNRSLESMHIVFYLMTAYYTMR